MRLSSSPSQPLREEVERLPGHLVLCCVTLGIPHDAFELGCTAFVGNHGSVHQAECAICERGCTRDLNIDSEETRGLAVRSNL